MIKRLSLSLLLLAFLLVPAQAQITVGNSTAQSGDATTISVAHNNDGDFVFMCGMAITSGSANITSQTYNAVGMTQIGSEVSQSDLQDSRISYINPGASGSNTALQGHDAAEASSFIVLSLNGVDQTSPIGQTESAQGSSFNPSDTIITTTDNSLVIACVYWEDGGDSLSASGWTECTNCAVSEGSSSQQKMWTKTTTTAGSNTFPLTSGATDDYIIRLIEVKEAAVAGGSRRVWLTN